MSSPVTVDAYRLLRRLLLLTLPKGPRQNPNLNEAEYVEMFVGQVKFRGAPPSQLGNLIRGTAGKAGLPERQLHEYSQDDWLVIAKRLAAELDQVEALEPGTPDHDLATARAQTWPDWPMGWQSSLRAIRRTG